MPPFGQWARYARRVDMLLNSKEKLLLIDTCGETAGIALSVGQRVVAAEDLTRGNASAEIVGAVRRLLEQVGWRLAELDAIGVVSGPGSFTGMRVGLATAKGLCEAAGLPLTAVSRLEVLADAATMDDCLVALDAGRGELYVRDGSSGRDWLTSSDELEAIRAGRPIVVAETRVAERLRACAPIVWLLCVSDSLRVVMQHLHTGDDMSLVDANYVREESDIYRRPASASITGTP